MLQASTTYRLVLMKYSKLLSASILQNPWSLLRIETWKSRTVGGHKLLVKVSKVSNTKTNTRLAKRYETPRIV